MNKLVFLFLLLVLIPFTSAIDSFTVNSVLMKISLHQGEKVVKTLSVTALEAGNFEANVDELSGITLNGKTFVLKAGEKKDILFEVDTTLLEPGVYTGHVSLQNEREHLDIPVVIEIESEDVFFDLNLDVPPQYSEVAPGEKFIAQVKVFDLTGFKAPGSLGPSPITIVYELRSTNGDIISVGSDTLIVDKQAQLSKTFVLPTTTIEGDYFFTATAKHKTSLGTASYFFVVRSKTIESHSLFSPEFIAVLVAFGLFFLIVFAFIIYLVRDRNKLFAELYQYNSTEFKRHQSLLQEQKRYLQIKGVAETKVNKEVEQKLTRLKASQEKRVNQLRTLEQKGDVTSMQRKLALWRKQGYTTMGLEHKLTGLSKKEMQTILKDWKKKYHTEDYKNR